MNDNIVTFAGVPLVRIIKIKRKWQVQMRDDESSDAWINIGDPFFSREKAIEEAPYLCEF